MRAGWRTAGLGLRLWWARLGNELGQSQRSDVEQTRVQRELLDYNNRFQTVSNSNRTNPKSHNARTINGLDIPRRFVVALLFDEF
jgi:hypothetical protein